jgi:hypothetical protein
VGGSAQSVWRLCALGGYASGALGSVAIAAVSGDAPLGVALLAVGAALAFLLVTAVTLVVTGEEVYIFFHHAIAVVATTAALASATGLGLARSMDYAMVGLGVCLAIGRVGCLMVGCCPGRPASRGIVYGVGHVDHGFPAALVGRPLVPVQAAEAAVVAVLTGITAAMILAGARPGAAAALWLATYATARFGLEFGRSEIDHHSAAGLTQAQWTALVIVGVVVAVDRGPVGVAALVVVASVAAGRVGVVLRRRARILAAPPPAPANLRRSPAGSTSPG